MNKKRVYELCECIDKAFIELAKITGVNHISAYCIDGSVDIEDLTDISNQKIYYSAN